MAAADATHAADRAERLLDAWRRFSYNLVMVPATGTEARAGGDQAGRYSAAIVGRAASSQSILGGVRQARPGEPLLASSECLAAAAELLACTEEKWFSGELGAALDDKPLGLYGLLETKTRIGRLFDLDARPAGVRLDIGRLAQPQGANVLAAALPFLQLVDRGIAQINARLPPRVGHVVSDEPDPDGDTYAFLCDPGLPGEIAGILLSKAKAVVAVALLDAAVCMGVPMPPWMGLICANLIANSAREELEGLLASPGVNLPEAAQLGARPIDIDEIWTRHEAMAQAYRAFLAAARESGLPVYPPFDENF